MTPIWHTPATLLGRLASGLEHDRGVLVHAVDRKGQRIPWDNAVGFRMVYPAACGAKPGKRSVGWEYNPVSLSGGSPLPISCPRCLKKLTPKC